MQRSGLFWGVALSLVGVLLLLNTLGIIRVDVWGLIWPSVLILIGLSILWGAVTRPRRDEAQQVAIPLDGASKADVRIGFGAGRLVVNGNAGATEIASGTVEGGFDYQTSRDGDTLKVRLRNPVEEWWPFPWMGGGHRREWTLGLNNQVPLTLDIGAGASESLLDLSNVRVTDLKLDVGASNAELTLPGNAGFTKVGINAGAASVSIRVPAGVAARVRFRGGAASFSADQARFPRAGKVYQSADYDSAPNKVDIHVDAGAGSVEVR